MADRAVVADIQHFSLHDGPEIRTTVFFKGCPLSCRWCHNPETISSSPQLLHHSRLCNSCGLCSAACSRGSLAFSEGKLVSINRMSCNNCGDCAALCPHGALEMKGRTMAVDSIVDECLLDRAYYRENGGVTLSGGEATFQTKAILHLLKALKRQNIHVVLDTCGFTAKEVVKRMLPYVDLYYYDLKCFSSALHKQWTGASNRLIIDNLKYLLDCNAELVVRIPLIPNFNDNGEEISRIAGVLEPWREKVSIHLLPYHNLAISKYKTLGMPYTLSGLKELRPEKLMEFKKLLESHGHETKLMRSR